MKKLLFIALILLSCEKEQVVNDNIDFDLLLSMIGKTYDNLKSDFKFPLISETVVAFQPHLLYKYAPGTIEFTAEIHFSSNIVSEIALSFTDNDYADAIKMTKLISDKIQAIYAGKPYSSVFMPGNNYVLFSDRAEYWNYVDANPVTFAITESWDLGLMDVNLAYKKNENKVYVVILTTPN
jgi:hypothetical protein